MPAPDTDAQQRLVDIYNKVKAAAGTLTGADGDDHHRGRRRRRAAGACGRPRCALALPAWFWFVFFFLVPVGFIVVYSFGYKPGRRRGPSPPTSSRSTATRRCCRDPFYETFLQHPAHRRARAPLLCLVIAFPIAYWMAVKASSQRWKGLLLALVIVPFWTSFLVRTDRVADRARAEGLAVELAADARRP